MTFKYYNDRSVPVVMRVQHQDNELPNDVIINPQELKTITIRCSKHRTLFIKEWDNNVLFVSTEEEQV